MTQKKLDKIRDKLNDGWEERRTHQKIKSQHQSSLTKKWKLVQKENELRIARLLKNQTVSEYLKKKK